MTGRRLKVLIWAAHHLEDRPIVDDYIRRVREVFREHYVSEVAGRGAYRGHLEGVEVLVCWGFHPDILKEADSLKWIQFGSAGINHAMTPELLGSAVRLTTQTGLHPVPVAEHALAMMLAVCRRLDVAIANQQHSLWERKSLIPTVREFQGSWVGVVGMGHIGREVARKARALGANIVATRSSQAGPDEADEWVDKADLSPLLAKSDFVVIATPLTPATEGMIGSDQIAAMKPGSVLVNIARGSIVDEVALTDALRSGAIGGACLDSFQEEPLPPGSPLWGLPNVLITPHVAGTTPVYGERGAKIVAANLRAYLAGERMPTEYDRTKGY